MDEFLALLRLAPALITYRPLSDEPDIEKYLAREAIACPRAVVPQDMETDPLALARTYAERFLHASVVILVPGRKFDATGNRQGRGRGWYDRFLSAVPKTWIRIGVARASDVLKNLPAEPWDEPVDYLLIEDGQDWLMRKTGNRLEKYS
jgi:5,10-methenyltetrahydrofolate synthetase